VADLRPGVPGFAGELDEVAALGPRVGLDDRGGADRGERREVRFPGPAAGDVEHRGRTALRLAAFRSKSGAG
jgi:hypothetical protein